MDEMRRAQKTGSSASFARAFLPLALSLGLVCASGANAGAGQTSTDQATTPSQIADTAAVASPDGGRLANPNAISEDPTRPVVEEAGPIATEPTYGPGPLFRERAEGAINVNAIGQSATGSAYIVVVDRLGGRQDFALGIADPAIGYPPDEETLFPMMSNSKAVAGSYFSLVFRQRGISLDAPAADWAPPNFATLYPKITIRHLLTHTHGLPDWPNRPIGWDVNTLSAWLTGVTPVDSPGGTPRYTSTGLMIAAAISANVEQLGFIDAIRQLLFNRLNMTRTGYNLLADPNQAMPVGPNWPGDLLATCASLYSTPNDMAKLLQASVGIGPIDIVEAIGIAQRENLGWNQILGISSLGYYWHSGSYGNGLNLFSAIRVNPTNGTAAVVMTANRTANGNDSGILADAMLRIAAQREFVAGIR